MDVCDFDNDDDEDGDEEDDDDEDDEDDDIVYLLQGGVHKFGLHASVDAPLVPGSIEFLFFSPWSLFHSLSSVLMIKRIFEFLFCIAFCIEPVEQCSQV